MARGNNSISNSENMIDMRDVADRIEYLESDQESIADAVAEAQSEYDAAENALAEAESDEANNASDIDVLETARDKRKEELESATDELKEWEESEDAEELTKLRALVDDCGSDGMLIRDDYFTEAMREQTVDIGDLLKDILFYLVIDWDATADNLKADYSCVEFDGVTYYHRD